MTVAEAQIWFTFAIVAAAIVSYTLERVSMELTSLGILAALLLFFHMFPVPGGDGTNMLSPERLLAGFSSAALVSIMALMVIGQGLYQTGALDDAVRLLLKIGKNRPALSYYAAFVIAALVSAFMSNTPVVIMFIPVVTALAQRLNLAPAQALMPISFVSILGGMTTLIGSSTNLVVSGVAQASGAAPIDFFEPTIPGLVLAGVGIIYVLIIAPHLLPARDPLRAQVGGTGGRQFIAQIEITPGHVLLGAHSHAGLFPQLEKMTVRMIQRGEHGLLPPFEDVSLRLGDVVIVAATRAALSEALTARKPILVTSSSDETEDKRDRLRHDLLLAEAVVAPGSRLIGRSVEQAHLRADTGAIVLGVQRRSRMIRAAMGSIRLAAGDVILVLGTSSSMRRLRRNRDVLLVEWTQMELPKARLAPRALLILLATVLAAATGLVPIVVAALVGAAAMLPAGCLNMRQAARAFDRRIYLLIGASLALAAPLEATGAAALIAQWVVALTAGGGTALVMSAMFLLVAVFTNVLSNHATAALFTPIAVSTASTLGVDPSIFVLTVLFAANCSFATPMAYQTNLLVMGPGRYRFADFLKAGTPLVLLTWVVYSLFAPWYFGI